jgi:aspartyl-tRNA(Asn)/glutamyl-tRNA(Gln) amidotransferase subunit B
LKKLIGEETLVDYEVVIGLEVHAQLLTDSKIFCSCSTLFGGEPNTHTCPVCTGMPGVLPVANKKVIDLAIKTALATNCTVAPLNQFARKNYFYPDLPKGYQISQFEKPLAIHGHIEIETGEEKIKKKIGITRIHLEEDAGKLLHEIEGVPSQYSYVDLNRTGVPLMEIVSEPDIRTPEEAAGYLRNLRAILQYLEVCDGNMEEGSFRCDANISLRPEGQRKLGTKVELKNMNSFRHVQHALEFEAERQRSLLEEGTAIVQETRLWDPNQGITASMRSKEEAHDYRYFPDPDLIPVVIGEQWVEEIRRLLPELPAPRRNRFVNDYQIPAYDAEVLTGSKSLADYYEECVKNSAKPKMASNWIMGDLQKLLHEHKKNIEECPITPSALAGMLKMVDGGVISGKIAKKVFEEMFVSGREAAEIVKEKGLQQVSDEGEISTVIDGILKEHAQQVEEYRQGKEKVFGFFVGAVMKATKGKANPKLVNELLRKKLGG